jgi:DMSO/TMAO reductase YedYZ molybdopterin-dependent catalytic subunit
MGAGNAAMLSAVQPRSDCQDHAAQPNALKVPLASEWGAPVRLRIPTKLGFKSAKNLQAIEVTHVFPGGYWEDQGYDLFPASDRVVVVRNSGDSAGRARSSLTIL